MKIEEEIAQLSELVIEQRRELVELFGFETRNKYAVLNTSGKQLAFAVEQQKGIAGFLFRQFLGHWRSFAILIFDENKEILYRAVHPFRFYFQRLELHDATGRMYGAIQKRFSILSKTFDVEDEHGNVIMSVSSPIWRIWTFQFMKGEREVATVRKRWRGLIQEGFLDADRFTIEFPGAQLPTQEKILVLAAALFIDILYFENHAQM